MPATQNIELAKGYDAGGPLTKNRFVKQVVGTATLTVVQCDTAGEQGIGTSVFNVSDAEILRGKGASVIEEGIAILEAGAAVTEMQAVMTDNVGRAVPATSGNFILGYVREPASALGNQCSVRLEFSGAKVP